jgi:protein-S-isoprenylcysteine O-methyltransferase Ste14
MYLAVISVIAGQGLILAKFAVLLYGVFVWLCFHLFVLAYEDPTLRASFAAEHTAFCANVPRWIPRVTPCREGREVRRPL